MSSTRSVTARDRGISSFLAGLVTGLAPLGILIGVLLLTSAATAALRVVLMTQGYAMQHAALPIVFGLGLLAALVGGVVGVKYVLIRMRRWDEAGEAERVNGSRWALIITALLLALLVFLAFVIPQNPAVAG